MAGREYVTRSKVNNRTVALYLVVVLPSSVLYKLNAYKYKRPVVYYVGLQCRTVPLPLSFEGVAVKSHATNNSQVPVNKLVSVVRVLASVLTRPTKAPH